ncbi:MAG: hypothetical protein ACTSYD_12380 [Candidatus Heimdallarchaeaceae archaeon]
MWLETDSCTIILVNSSEVILSFVEIIAAIAIFLVVQIATRRRAEKSRWRLFLEEMLKK